MKRRWLVREKGEQMEKKEKGGEGQSRHFTNG